MSQQLSDALQRVHDEYEEAFGRLPPLYSAVVWVHDDYAGRSDLKLLVKEAARSLLKIDPLVVSEYLFDRFTPTDAKLPSFFYLDPYSLAPSNMCVYWIVECNRTRDHLLMERKSCGSRRMRGPLQQRKFNRLLETRTRRREQLQLPAHQFWQFANAAYPLLVQSGTLPFLPRFSPSNDDRMSDLSDWKLVTWLHRLAADHPDQFGSSYHCMGWAEEEREIALVELVSQFRPNFQNPDNWNIVKLPKKQGRYAESLAHLPRDPPVLISVLRDDILEQGLRVVKAATAGLLDRQARVLPSTKPLDRPKAQRAVTVTREGESVRFSCSWGDEIELKTNPRILYLLTLIRQRRELGGIQLMTFGIRATKSERDSISAEGAELNEISAPPERVLDRRAMDDIKKEAKEIEQELNPSNPKDGPGPKRREELLKRLEELVDVRQKQTRPGGRPRLMSNKDTECNAAVAAALKRAVEDISRQSDYLGGHLKHISRRRSGKFEYRPDDQINWTFSF